MHKFKFKILLSLLLCLLFCSQVLLPVFAEDSDATVLDGYHVDDVPYSSDFDTVLTASDDEYVLYSADNDKTYKSSSALAVSESDSSNVLYSKKSITDMIPKNIWRGSDSPSITFPVQNGYTGVKYIWADGSNAHSFYHYFEMSPFNFFKSERKYRITFTLSLSKVKGNFNFYLSSVSDTSQPVIPLVSVNAPQSDGSYLSSSSRSYSFDFVAPNGVSALVPVVKGSINGKEFLFYINDFTVSDITSEDLDNSLGKLGDRIKGFFDNLVESIKGFFIPKEGFFDDVKERFDKLLSEHLGFLYQAPSMVVKILQLFVDWQPSETPYLDFPAVDFDVAGTHVHLWDKVHYTFDFLQNAPFSTLYAFYKTLVFCIISLAMVNLAIKKYHNIIGGGSDDN